MSAGPNRRTRVLAIGTVVLAALVIIAVFALRGHGGTSAASGAATGDASPTTVTLAPIGAAGASPQPSQNTQRASTATTERSSTTERSATRTTTVVTARDGVATIAESSLPAQARTTLKLIDDGGPFPYRQDGVVWQNRERRLPSHERGYYHEYTVVTPGSPDRGARRIITGSDGERYYTDDHYGSFRLIVPG